MMMSLQQEKERYIRINEETLERARSPDQNKKKKNLTVSLSHNVILLLHHRQQD